MVRWPYAAVHAGHWWLSPSEKDLGVVVDTIWKIIKKCAVIINRVDYILGYIRRNGAIQSRHVIIPPPLGAGGAAPGIGCRNCWSPHQKNARDLERVSLEGYQGVLGPRAHVLRSVRREWGNWAFFCPAERRLRGNLTAACNYLKGSFKGNER